MRLRACGLVCTRHCLLLLSNNHLQIEHPCTDAHVHRIMPRLGLHHMRYTLLLKYNFTVRLFFKRA